MTSRRAGGQTPGVWAYGAVGLPAPFYAVALICGLTLAGVFWLRADGPPEPAFVDARPLPSAPLAPVRSDASPQPDGRDEAPAVTRAATLPDVVGDPMLRKSEEPVSHQLRQPIRLIGTDRIVHDLPALIQTALNGFGQEVARNDRLRDLLVTTLSEGQSDAYVHAVLNAALERGELRTPTALLTVSGELDTPALLAMVLQIAKGTSHAPNLVGGDHVLSAEDSLAGLALRYYGTPERFPPILAANAALVGGLTGAQPGTRIAIPTL